MTRTQELGITVFPYREFDSNSRETYHEESSGTWVKREFDSNGNQTYYENYTGYWVKKEYDSMGKKIYSEDSNGDWSTLNENGERIHSTTVTRNYPEYAKALYCHMPDDMIIKQEQHIDWLMISFLPTLSKNIIDKYSDRLNLNIVNFFNKNIEYENKH
jgi:hypothetical protein